MYFVVRLFPKGSIPAFQGQGKCETMQKKLGYGLQYAGSGVGLEAQASRSWLPSTPF